MSSGTPIRAVKLEKQQMLPFVQRPEKQMDLEGIARDALKSAQSALSARR
jgi:hypothetical protein